MAVPKKVADRLVTGVKRFLPVLEQQRARDVSEADTVTLVKDLLSEVFGYDKYAELTSEHAIRGTFCDLAVKLDDKLSQLIEVKAIGLPLEDRHVKQAVDYAANEGCEWVMLTNAAVWRFYHVIFEKPIDKQLIAEVDLTSLDLRKDDTLDRLFLFTKEGFRKGVHIELRDRQDATSRFILASLLVENEQVATIIRRELRRIVNVNVSEAEIIRVLREEVIKREAMEGPSADAAKQKVRQTQARAARDRDQAKAKLGIPECADVPVDTSATPAPQPEADASDNIKT